MLYGDLVKADLKEIADWYQQINPALKARFLRDFREKTKYIREFPLSSEIKYDEIRLVFLKKFPVAIHYTFRESLGEIVILAVFHTARNPAIWAGRK